MSDHVYRLTEVVGSSETSVADAIRTAVRKASQTVRNIEWFEAEEIRGQVVDGDVALLPGDRQARVPGRLSLSRSCPRRPGGRASGARRARARPAPRAAGRPCPGGTRPCRPVLDVSVMKAIEKISADDQAAERPPTAGSRGAPAARAGRAP